MITLNSVNDAYSIVPSPSSCVIRADYNGDVSPEQLQSAYVNVTLYRGKEPVKFTLTPQRGSSPAIRFNIQSSQDGYTQRIQFTALPSGALSGEMVFSIEAADDYYSTLTVPFTIIRESSMLDWIIDWNGRKTQIDGESVISPKAFFGTKDSQNRLNGVYIGPNTNPSSGGIYAFKDCPESAFGNFHAYEIFHLDENGGAIGGWDITHKGICKQIEAEDGILNSLEMLSEGTLRYGVQNHWLWAFNKDGSGLLAGGKISWNTDGDAVFDGKIISTSGKIGGWDIGRSALYNTTILIDSKSSFIGVRSDNTFLAGDVTKNLFYFDITRHGGIAIFHKSAQEFGIEGWSPDSDASTATKVFSLGYSNQIAGWSFDNQALYLGKRNNTAKQYTASAGDITIGTAGLRGKYWYIDTDGEVSFMNGLLSFASSGSRICGWSLSAGCLSSSRASLVSEDGYTGLYLAANTSFVNVGTYTAFESHIQSKGGVYVKTNSTGSVLAAYDQQGQLSFQLLSTGTNKIAGWWFDNETLYTGTSGTGKNSFANKDSITLSPDGIRGCAWRFEKDGSGAVAKGNIQWTAAGDVTFGANVKLSWSQISGTDGVMTTASYINANGLFTGKISADNIQAGTISTASIKSNGHWSLDIDGSGYLANGKINWENDGDLSVEGAITVNTLKYKVCTNKETQAIDGTLGYNYNGGILPELKPGEAVSIKIVNPMHSRTMAGDLTLTGANSNVLIFMSMRPSTSASSKLVISGAGHNSGCIMELLGFHGETQTATRWVVIPLTQYTEEVFYNSFS